MQAKSVDIPLFRELVPGGIDYGTVVLVEFEPQSCWYEASYTIAAQSLRSGLKTDLHLFQHDPKEARNAIRNSGLDVKSLEDRDLLRFIDSFSVQVGVNQADIPKGADAFKTSSVRIEDWAEAAGAQIAQEIDDSERQRVHIDDHTAVLARYNREDDIIDYWRTRIIPLYKERQGVLINAVVLCVASDSCYRQHESLADMIVDCRSREEDGVVEHYIRVRTLRGKSADTRWQHVKVVDGEVTLDQGRGKEAFLSPQAELPSNEEGERRLAAIMFTDTVGFTGLGQRDESLMMELLREQRSLLRPIFARHRGREVKTMGDGFLVEFTSAAEAVKCAMEIQTCLGAENGKREEERKIAVRIGIHLGDVIHVGSDVAGDAVNVASRIEPLAPAGGICVSGQVYDSVVNKVPCSFESLGSPKLK
ncbi:MAG TPA: adenylate/guanylate cyclase domain-containing protein, partial [Nitrososphaerales archaeon]|nr:adenylate/guanylate cyclase domain-containing protein [Nitrososphaerales archaeon]